MIKIGILIAMGVIASYCLISSITLICKHFNKPKDDREYRDGNGY